MHTLLSMCIAPLSRVEVPVAPGVSAGGCTLVCVIGSSAVAGRNGRRSHTGASCLVVSHLLLRLRSACLPAVGSGGRGLRQGSVGLAESGVASPLSKGQA